MITNELNTGLVNAVREKLPSKENLANTLMDILYIGKEAIYRRLRRLCQNTGTTFFHSL